MNEREDKLNEDVLEPAETVSIEDVLTGTDIEGVAAVIEDLYITDTKRVYNTINKLLDDKGVPVDVEI